MKKELNRPLITLRPPAPIPAFKPHKRYRKMNHNQIAEIVKAVNADQSLQEDQKKNIIGKLHDKSVVSDSGLLGGGLGLLVAKYLKLSDSAKVLLSVAGFGIGQVLHQASNDPKKFQDYNKKLKVYEIR